MNAKPKRSNPHGWKANDVRDICPCQAHARRERSLWRRSMRAVRARGVALIVGVPLAFGALEFPIEAMNMSIPAALKLDRTTVAAQAEVIRPVQAPAMFPIFTTRRVREQFLSSANNTGSFTLELAREHFFRTHVPYGSIIYREAKRHNLPPELVAAVVASESDFRPRLISQKNAQGLMQLIPSTGRLMGAGDLFNPSENIAAGTKYLRYLFNRFGDEVTVLAAYNAGEGNVEKFGGIPPFPETINYVRKVNARTASYRQRIQGTYIASIRMRSSMQAY